MENQNLNIKMHREKNVKNCSAQTSYSISQRDGFFFMFFLSVFGLFLTRAACIKVDFNLSFLEIYINTMGVIADRKLTKNHNTNHLYRIIGLWSFWGAILRCFFFGQKVKNNILSNKILNIELKLCYHTYLFVNYR